MTLYLVRPKHARVISPPPIFNSLTAAVSFATRLQRLGYSPTIIRTGGPTLTAAELRQWRHK